MPDLFPAPSTQYYRRCEIRLLREWIPSLAGLRVLKLDLWNEAVNTRILHWMRDHGAETFGIDLSSVTVRRALLNGNKAPTRSTLTQSDMRALPYRDDCFDLVYAMGTIEHVEEYGHAVREIRRVLKPGGAAIIGVPDRHNLFLRPLLVRLLESLGKYAYSPERTFSSAELRRLLESCGLRVERRTGLLSIPGILRMGELFLYRRQIPLYSVTSLLIRPFEGMETRWGSFRRLGYLLVMLARKPAP